MTQHNHHCKVTFAGINWLIVRTENHGQYLYVIHQAKDQYCKTIIDVSAVDWEGYARDAVAMDYINGDS
jgi:hypothetical protein